MNLATVLATLQSNRMEIIEANTRSLEERIRNLEFQNRQQESRFYASQEGDIKDGSSTSGSRKSSQR